MSEKEGAIQASELGKYFSYAPDTGEIKRIGARIRNHDGRLNKGGYLVFDVSPRKLFGHRVAWAMFYGFWPKCIDHINGIRTDNKISNLRLASMAENSRNMRPQKNKLVPYKGVSKQQAGYDAKINMGSKRHWLGNYSDPVEAALAYDRAAIYFFDEFAVTNWSLGLLAAQAVAKGGDRG